MEIDSESLQGRMWTAWDSLVCYWGQMGLPRPTKDLCPKSLVPTVDPCLVPEVLVRVVISMGIWGSLLLLLWCKRTRLVLLWFISAISPPTSMIPSCFPSSLGWGNALRLQQPSATNTSVLYILAPYILFQQWKVDKCSYTLWRSLNPLIIKQVGVKFRLQTC